MEDSLWDRVSDEFYVYRDVILAFIAGAAVSAVVVLALTGGGDDTTEQEGAGGGDAVAEVGERGDVEAATMARTAQTAIETYATDNQGLYTGATSEALARIESSLDPTAVLVESPTALTYTVGASARGTGTVFSITRNPDGEITYSCDAPGEGECPESGDWSR